MWNQAIASPIGSLQASWSECGLFALSFAPPLTASVDIEGTPLPRKMLMLSGALSESLETYFETGKLQWSLELLDWAEVSEFHRRVLRQCHAIPTGETLSYGQLARLAGSPHAARAVGGAMARNRWPLIIPCHRVVGCSGKLTGYSGEGGTKTKHWLLEHEFHASQGNLFLMNSQ